MSKWNQSLNLALQIIKEKRVNYTTEMGKQSGFLLSKSSVNDLLAG
jgi:hypothetical protein